jgi:acylphosphatase
MVAIHCIVKGRVQGVGYVRNNQDGTVTVEVHGLPDTLRECIEYLHEGSILSVVEAVEVEWLHPSVTYHDFSVLH